MTIRGRARESAWLEVSLRWFRAGAVVAALAGVAGMIAVAEPRHTIDAPVRITIDAAPITIFDNRDPAATRFGRLEFRGGFVLTSKHEAFGGLSALHMEPDGSHFITISDRGSWLTGRLAYEDERPVGISDARLAPILGADGRPLASRGWYDTESLAVGGGALFVGIERAEQIVRFDYGRDGVGERGQAIPVPGDFKTLTKNRSLECLAVVPAGSSAVLPAGTLIVITEHSLNSAGNHRAYLLNGAKAERFSVRRTDGFDISDCTLTPDGGLLLLERSFSILSGVAMRIRRVALAAIRPGAVIDGSALIAVDLAYQIDNMEGIGLHRNRRGETILTLVSDDNFNVIQRTLLLQFALIDE